MNIVVVVKYFHLPFYLTAVATKDVRMHAHVLTYKLGKKRPLASLAQEINDSQPRQREL